MRITKSTDSPFGSKIFFEKIEFEISMDCLRNEATGADFKEGKGIDVERVLLECYSIEPDYVELPNGIVGRTLFWPDGIFKVDICSKLADNSVNDIVSHRRLRTTLAHEIGHISCHKILFVKDTLTLPLFGLQKNIKPKATIVCREDNIGSKLYDGEWWEFQANQCMASLLMPKKHVNDQVQKWCDTYSFDSCKSALERDRGPDLIRDLAEVFDVNAEPIFYRLRELGYFPSEYQVDIEFKN